MNTALLAVLIVAGVLLLAGLIWLVAIFASRKALGELEKRLKPVIQARFAGREVLRAAYEANFFGLQSRGLAQVRGNGALVLLRDKLYFLQAVTKREITMPLADIEAVSLVKSHLGKRIGRPLLRVDFRAAAAADAVAWYVYDAAAWKSAIEEARLLNGPGP
jgi:hypothetical protein